ncbi:MAG: YihY/virulence factor BrkB family protein, partial [Gammaproteobacteria bacterium]|jgi:membrane protein
LGDKGVEITERVIGFVSNIKVGVLGSVGLVLLVYTAVSLLQKIESSFNHTWYVSEGRSIIQRFSQYLSVILIGPVLVFTALGITASITSYAVVQHLMQIQAIGVVFEAISRIIPYMLVIVAFTFVYMLIPNTKVYFKSAIVGGLVAGVLWESAGWIFASFVVNSTKYMAIYTVFASLIIFMIWLYVSWLILLIGCSISFYHQNSEHRRLHARGASLSNRMKEKLAIAIMAMIGRLYYQKRPPCSARQLANSLGVDFKACEKVIKDLLAAKLLLETADEPPALTPAYALERMAVKDAVNAVRVSGESRDLNPLAITNSVQAQQAYEQLEVGVQNSLEGLCVKDLFSENDDSQVENELELKNVQTDGSGDNSMRKQTKN